jgi:tRNA (guanine-N7-)-methyltransferase
LLFDELMPSLVVRLPSTRPLNPQTLFCPRRASSWVEIGFGGGEHLAMQAAANPQVGLIGCEIFENGIAKLLTRIDRGRLENIRIFPDDARLLIQALLPASIDRVFILFPDPWPKRRHHKRRLVSPETLDALAEIMTDGAELHLATDDRNYLCWILEKATSHPAFEWLARRPRDWRERPQDGAPTRYQQKAQMAGRTSTFIKIKRRPRPAR